MPTRPRPGPPPLPAFEEMGKLTGEMKEYVLQLHQFCLELEQRVEALENAP